MRTIHPAHGAVIGLCLLLASGAAALAAQTMTYAYDAAGRLTSVTYGGALRTTYSYDLNGNILIIETAPVSSDAPGLPNLPREFSLRKAAPNPFPVSTVLGFDLPTTSFVSIVIYDLTGRRIRKLVDSALSAGQHAVTWDGADDSGREVASGSYFTRMKAGGFEATRTISHIH